MAADQSDAGNYRKFTKEYYSSMRQVGVHNTTTAVLIFANSSSHEVRSKRIVNGGNLFDELTRQTVRMVERSGLPYFLVTEKQQKGDTFGSRFTNAVEEIFQQGYQHVITLGNDTPGLKRSQLARATELLAEGQTVLGPSADGGFYLLGISRSEFQPRQWATLPWQSADLREAFISKALKSDTAICQLEVLSDIDSLEDIRNLAGQFFGFSKDLIRALSKVLHNCIYIPFRPNLHPSKVFLHLDYNKGSPFINR
ncbi:TIGR04282 family arsenosugar biosynthesis glycosyltransferase [Poritiphilus flavus]|uniref:DUF2064 domain-containing protein n=1 Tax=Poritiphilus flavus TaxID=2697053 RepID=A0A6L9E8P0_9FLAO|nr:DUF2064 domain-containing protein [Poritiphilus flavus]NAS10958.1 DUF2064 domain-containing protein [Poritiphilus flavus]